jgi:hypothetical protein
VTLTAVVLAKLTGPRQYYISVIREGCGRPLRARAHPPRAHVMTGCSDNTRLARHSYQELRESTAELGAELPSGTGDAADAPSLLAPTDPRPDPPEHSR